MDEKDYLYISDLASFAYCRREFALKNIEGLWEDNHLTVDGSIQHEKAHDYLIKESRGNIFISHAVRVVSHQLHLVGECDVVEFTKSSEGIIIEGKEGYWNPIPVEYKHGSESYELQYELQLCAQAMCLEEMLSCKIPYGFLYYKSTKQKEKIIISEELRKKVIDYSNEMMNYILRGHTPSVKPTIKCRSCSMKNICVSKLAKNSDVKKYIERHIYEKIT